MWGQIVDEAFFPLGSLPVLLSEEKEAEADVWVSIPGMKEWLTDHSLAEVSGGLRAVGEITSKELRDYRGMSLEATAGDSICVARSQAREIGQQPC
ncbi:MAG: hypothetical protein CL930_07390 [Deltaproteobacteria bacterium]|nr:hypothetical protein [Deltaproteobacteria bacterium]